MQRKLTPIRVVATLLLAALFVFLASQPAEHSVVEAESARQTQAGRLAGQVDVPGIRAGDGEDKPTFVTGLESLPQSLRDTEVDGRLDVDARGRLIIEPGIRHLFDYFLSTQGEESLPVILARLQAFIHNVLPEAAAAEAEALLDSYMDYLAATAGLQAPATPGQPLDVSTIGEHLRQLDDLRRDFFTSEVHEAFFGEESAYDRYTLARLEVMQDDSLSASERAARVALLEDQLPAALREDTQAISRYQTLQGLTGELREQGDTAQLRQVRESLVGAEATDRLEQLDAERDQWRHRVRGWLAERGQLLQGGSLETGDAEVELDRRRSVLFAEHELSRVRTLERIADQGAIDSVLGPE